MTELEIFEILKRILLTEIGVKAAHLNLETGLFNEELIDSLDWMSYLTKVEERFGISISDEDGEEGQLGIMKNMVSYLVEKTR